MYVSVFSEDDSVLLVGEGNFSFTVDLVDLLRLNITTTCLESDLLSEITKSNAEKLRERGVQVCVGVDGTKLSEHPVFGQKRFDKVVFNFPHVGGKMQLGRNRALLRQFLCSAAGMLREGGRVVVSLCRGQGGTPADQPRAWGDTWQAVEMAAHADLVLDDVHPFQRAAFPHYTCVGYRSRDSAFQLDGALVHVFRPAGPLLPLSPATLPTPACNYLLPFLHAFLRSRYHVRPVQLPPRVVGELLSHYCALIPPQGALDTQVGVAHTLVLPTSPPNLSAPPAAVQALLVGGHAGLGADFVRHILELFHRHRTFSVLVETGLRTVEGKSDVLLASKDEDGSRRPMCEEDLRTVEGKSDVLLASKDEDGSRRLMCEEDLRTGVEGKSNVFLVSKDEDSSRRLVCEEYVLEGSLLVSVLHLDRLAGVVLGAADWRELWAEGARVEVKDGVPSLKRACLHSVPHVLDVTFRVPCVWLEENLWAALWELAGSVISGVSLLNTYQSSEGWTSHCYRITYHSFSKAMSRNKAIMVHHIICEGLIDKLGVAIF